MRMRGRSSFKPCSMKLERFGCMKLTFFLLVEKTMYSKAVGVLVLAALLGWTAAFAAEIVDEPIRLEDGSYLFVDDEGTTRMVDRDGRPIKMRDNVEMKTQDGGVIVMRNKRVWRLVGPPGKRKRMSADD